MKKIAVVTGASKGIGAALCEALLRADYTVYGLSRTPGSLKDVQYLSCDVSDAAAVARTFAGIVSGAGRIDLLLANAGMGISGAAEFTGAEEVSRQMSVNFDGCVSCTRAVLPVMRRQGSGRIIFTSSMAAVFPIPYQSFYSASKAAVTVFAESLRMEVAAFGIEVSCLLLGDIKTAFTASREKNACGDDEYGGRISKAVAVMEHDEQTGMPPARVAARTMKLLSRRRLPPLTVVGGQYKLVYGLHKLLPVGLQLRILGKIYG